MLAGQEQNREIEERKLTHFVPTIIMDNVQSLVHKMYELKAFIMTQQDRNTKRHVSPRHGYKIML